MVHLAYWLGGGCSKGGCDEEDVRFQRTGKPILEAQDNYREEVQQPKELSYTPATRRWQIILRLLGAGVFGG